MTNQKQLLTPTVKDGLILQIRQLEMKEQRQAQTLKETQASLKALKSLIED